MVRHLQFIEPELRHGGEQNPFAGNRRRHDPIEGADAIRSDDHQAVAEVVDTAHLARFGGETGDFTA